MVSSDNPNVSTTLLRRPLHYWGIYSRVAKRLSVSRQFVSQVALGRKTSARVRTALVRELRKLDRELAA